jgi:hypothetical protein
VPKVRTNALAYAQLILALSTEQMGYEELAEFSGLHYHTVREHVTALRKAKLVRIRGWGVSALNAPTIPQFALCVTGSTKDVRKPDKKSGAERSRSYRERKASREAGKEIQLTISCLCEPVQKLN